MSAPRAKHRIAPIIQLIWNYATEYRINFPCRVKKEIRLGPSRVLVPLQGLEKKHPPYFFLMLEGLRIQCSASKTRESA